MAIQIKDTQQILINMLAEVSEKLDKREGSLIHVSLAPIAKVIAKTYLDLVEIENNCFIQTASGKYLDLIAEERAIIRKTATEAERKGRFNLEVGIGMSFETIAGADSLTYTTTEFIEKIGTNFYYRLKCSVAGVIGNGYTGGLTDLNNIDGLEIAQLEDILVPGEDVETDDDLRKRYMQSLDSKAFGGNLASYEEYLNKVAGVGPYQIYPFWNGGGTVLISFLNSEQKIPDTEFVKQLQTQICPPEADNSEPSANGYGLAPIGAKVTVRAPSEFSVNVSGKVMVLVGENFTDIKENIKYNIEKYLTGLRKNWGHRERAGSINYSLSVLYSQIYSQIINTESVINVRDITLNGSDNDLKLTETAQIQQVPFLNVLDLIEWV